MASLRDVVLEYQDNLRNGIAWLAFWREGRSWQAEAFHLDLDDTLYPEDRARLAEIQAADPRAIVVNGYYSGYLSEKMSVAELAAGVRHHYDNGLNNIAPFIEAHSDELPPDVLEAAREKAHAAGLPFYERPYRGDDIDPYTYDGHMSIEDYELMHKLMEQDREQDHHKETAPLEISNDLMLIDTSRTTFDMQAIQNRRFMFSPQTGELILGRQYRGNALVKSHAEEHGESGAKAPFDSFLRGWIGTGKQYKDGVIHFAPAIDASNPEQFDRAFSTVEMFARNGANGKTVIRGFGDVWEQPLSKLIFERSEPMSEVFSILLHNRQRYEQGKEGLWFSLPTTTEKLQEALREIGISADNPQDFFLYDYRSPQERPIKLPRDLVLSADVDELNFLAARLEKLDAAELAELNAALTSPQSDFHSIGQIIDYPDNVDYYVHLPDVTGTGQLGDYYLNRSGMVDMPEEWKAGIFLPRFGLHIANTEHGVFTDYGYLVKSGDEWQRVHEGQPVPEEYRVMAYPAPEILRDEAPAKTVQPEAAPAAEAAAPPPVVPIILNSQNSADRMKEITDRLETGIQELFESERYKAYLTSMAKFHSYSFNNTLLIAMQGGQLVAGYNKWRDDFHRNVKRGEKGIKILAPAPYKVKKEVPKLDEQGQPVMDKDGNPVTEKKEIQVPAFKIVSVFDVSQTEGEPLPSIGVDELTGNVEQYEDFFKALEQTSPVPMAFEDIPGGSHGYYHLIDKRIAIQENMSELQTLKTAIHEIAHAKLHAIDPEAPVTEQADRPDSRTREVQAESVAYAVCQHYGLDTSNYSFGYVAGWSSGKDLKELRASLETIRATAHELITAIDDHLAELQQQRQAQQAVEQAAEQLAPDSVFAKLPPEQQQEMTDSVKAMLQTLIDADVKATGEVTQGTLDAIQTQGFVLSSDGTLQRAEAQPEPQPWNGIDGLLNNKPIMPEATPTERAAALIELAESSAPRLGNEERRLIMEYAEAVGDTDKVIELINRLCEQGYEMQHGHMDDFVRSQIESEIAVAKAEQQTALDPAAEPIVTIIWSESPHLKDGQQMPLHEADTIFKELDSAKRYEREQPDYKGSWYDKTKFRIDFTMQGQPDNYEGRQDFGDGDGSLIEHIRGYHEYYAQDESWKNHVLKHEGPEAWEADKAQRDMLLHEFVPYMSLHCNLAAMEHEARRPLQSGETLTPEQTAYFQAVLDYVKECRPLLNQGQYQLPEPPKLTDFDQSLQDYKAQVEAEIAQEAADAGMTVEEYAAAGYEAPAPAQVVTSDAEPQAAPAKSQTELQEKALEIADRYKDLPLQAKIDVIAQAFGCKTGEIHTSPCTGKWRGTSDMTIRFDNGASLFIGNHLTPKAKTVKVQTECVNRTLVQYNPEIVKATKEAALPALLQREAKDNEIAAQKGLKPYTLLNVEFNEGADEKTGGYIGWYYVTLAVDGKICTHLETGLNHDIADGKVSDTPTRADYYPAGALKEADVDYVFNNVGFSSASTLYTVPLRDDVRERAEKTLAERSTAAPEASREWGFYIIPDLKTWATNAEQQTPIEHFATFEEAKARFDELRSQPYNSEAKDLNTDGRPYAHLTLGIESKDGMSAVDILHVRAGQNYLVEDFTRMERLRSDPVVLESLSRVAQEIGFDRVRPYVMENGSYKAMPDMPFTQWENPYFTVNPPAQEQGDTFAIYQLKGGPETRDYRFEAYESLQEAGLAVDRQNYDLVYTAPLDGKTTLEDIYRTFNLDRPADFTGHSLSVSDVVVLTRSGKEEAHYCDSFGFTPVPEFFLQREKQLTPRELLTGESIQTPRGSFLVTDMSREQLEAAGYGFHHQSEDGKYLIMGNGTDAFAIPAQQESPIKAAEMTTEQNYNMIDGVLNNAPTMSELEAKAKAGEQISLFDVAEAAKAEARKPKQTQRPAQKQKKPSIRAQLKAAKEEQQKKPPQREKAQELEV